VGAEELVSSLFVIAPGFVALKLFQVLGTSWKRTDWEWVIWSLVAGALIAVGVTVFGIQFVAARELTLTPDAVVTTSGVPERFAVAALAGTALGLLWRRLPWAHSWRRGVENSAWDLILQSAADERRGVEVATKEGDRLERFYGALHTFGRESDQAEAWVYLTKVRRFNRDTDQFEPVDRTEGVLLHRDNIVRLHVSRPADHVDHPPPGKPQEPKRTS
jgi:hypothetical protein